LDILLFFDGKRDSKRRLDISESKWNRLRLSAFRRDAFTCQYCGESDLAQPHCDHVVPRARGGATTLENLATSCGPCNVSKGALLVEEWRQ
jgi:5-methylcytosine-specific restriction endonuclease McrA